MPTRRWLLQATLLAVPRRAAAAELDLPAVMAGLAAVPERRATFTETRRFAALNQPLLSIGRLLYRRPAFIEKTTDWPQPERLVVDGERLVLTEGNEPPRVIPLGSQLELRTLVDAIRGPLAGDLAALRRAFQVTGTGTLAAWTIGLVPADPRAARLLRRAEIAGHGAVVDRVLLVQANGDEQQMLMTEAAP